MCGIAGIWTSKAVDTSLLERMADAIVHRGPDSDGTWIDRQAGVGFGHRRLAIIDISPAGHQPMISPSGRYVLNYNGEIYNHASIRTDLEQNGALEWCGRSDTETLLAAIEHWGLVGTLERSVGMFALALWDRRYHTLSLARDRMGEKPLFYGWTGEQFCFGSELKAFYQVPGIQAEIDRASLDCLVRYAYIPAPRSIHRDIFKLLPGAILELTPTARDRRPASFTGMPGVSEGISLKHFWSLPEIASASAANPVHDESDAARELETLLIGSAKRQSVADVPVGTFLSGGYDSSTIAALQQAHTSSRVKTFTIGFDEVGFDESPHARAVAEHLKTDHYEMRVSATDALAVIPNLATIYDEPFADSSQIPTYLLSKLARTHVKVALSGDGGDELFGGYNRYLAFARSNKLLRRVPGLLRKAASATIRAMGRERLNQLSALTGFDRRFPQAGQKAEKLAALIRNGHDLQALYPLLLSQWPPGSIPVAGVNDSCRNARLEPIPGLDDLTQMMTWDMLDYLPDDILCKVDRASMAASLETRAPFLDHQVVEYALRIPAKMKIGPDGGKNILRRILYSYVPRELLDRPKAGFAIPIGQWLRGPLRDWAESLLDARALAHEGLFDSATIRAHWTTHLSGRRDYSSALWPVLIARSWLETNRSSQPRIEAKQIEIKPLAR